jgi:predicted ATPase
VALEAASGLAESFASGIVLVDLAPLSDPALVAAAIAGALDVPASSMAQLAERLGRDTAGAPLLLVLDSVERVATVAPQLGELLAAVPDLSLLATSRVALRIAAEHVLPVRPLDEDDAVALFVERARAASGPSAVAPGEQDAVRAVCRRLDGLPLAIELAAEGSRLLPPGALLARLERRLEVPPSGRVDLPRRQRSLRATLDWSWEILRRPERRLLTRLGVFVGGATLEAVDAVCNPDGELGADTLALATGLLSQAAIRRLDAGLDEPARLGMLDTIHDYAEERAAETGELGELRRRHASYFLQFAEEAAAHAGTMERRAWLDRQARERDNVRSAFAFFMGSGDTESALRLAIAFGRALPYDAHVEEVQGWLDAALDASDRERSRLPAAGLYWSGRLAITQGDYPRAADRLDACVALASRLDDAGLKADALTARGLAATMVGDPRARGCCEAALAAARAAGDRRRIAEALCMLAGTYERENAWERARPLTSESLTLFREVGDPDGIARTLNDLGWYALVDDDLDRADELIEESLRIRRQRGDQRELAETLANRAWLALRRDDPDGAGRRFGECFELARHVDDRFDVGECLAGLSAVAAARDEHALAALLHGAEQAAHEELGARPWESVDALRGPALSAARAALGEAAWAAAVTEGRRLRPEEGVARATDLTRPLPATTPR